MFGFILGRRMIGKSEKRKVYGTLRNAIAKGSPFERFLFAGILRTKEKFHVQRRLIGRKIKLF